MIDKLLNWLFKCDDFSEHLILDAYHRGAMEERERMISIIEALLENLKGE